MRPKTTLYFNINQLPAILTMKEAAIYLRCSEAFLKKQAAAGNFPAYKMSSDGRWYIEREDLLGYVQARKTKQREVRGS